MHLKRSDNILFFLSLVMRFIKNICYLLHLSYIHNTHLKAECIPTVKNRGIKIHKFPFKAINISGKYTSNVSGRNIYSITFSK